MWLDGELEGLYVDTRGGAMPKFWNQANYFWDFDSAMAVVVFLMTLKGEICRSHR